MNEVCDFSVLVRAPVRSRNRGSLLMRGTMTALPDCITLPVIPSPIL